MTTTFLHPDLETECTTMDGRPYVWHPLVIHPLGSPALVESANRVYAFKHQGVAEAMRSGDWHSYVFLHERPYRPEALETAGATCTGEPYLRLVRDVWIDAEQIRGETDRWRDILPRPRVSEGMMDDDERAALAALADPVRVFRGFSLDGCENGFSWTVDRPRAEWFAQRFAALAGTPRVACGVVPKGLVIAYLLERSEAEIITLPESVLIDRVESVPAIAKAS